MANSFPEILSTEIGRILLPIKVLDNADELTAFIKELGYSFQGVMGSVNLSGLVTDVETLITKIEVLLDAQTDEDKIEAALELIEQAIIVIDTLKTEVPNIESALNSVSNLAGEDLGNFAKVFLGRTIDNLVYTYLEDYRSPVFAFFYVLKLADEYTDVVSNQPYKKIAWDGFGTLFSSPVDLFDDAYAWQTNFLHDDFLRRFENLLAALQIPGGIYTQTDTIRDNLGRTSDPNPLEIRMPLYQAGVWGSNWQEIDLNLSPIPLSGLKKPGLLLYPYFFGGATVSADINEDWAIELTGNADMGSGIGLEIRPGEPLNIKTDFFTTPLDSTSLNIRLTLRKKEEGTETVLFGTKDSSYLSSTKIELSAFAQKSSADSDLGIELQMGTMKLVIKPGEDADGFLNKMMPDGFKSEFDFGLGYSLSRGVYFAGSGVFEIFINLHIMLGPLEIQGLSFGFKPTDEELTLKLGGNLRLEIGPFTAIVENIGVKTAVTFPLDGGRLGTADYSIGFKPPNGLGLFLETAAVKGGGYLFFDHDNHKYAGVAELSIKDKIALKAIGLISTRMPDGSKGFSMLLIITAEFTPINIGFGFTLNGVGGLVGVNRTMLLDVLRSGVKTGAVANILFPVDPVNNAPALIASIGGVFPVAEGRYAFGLMGKFGWGTPTLITIDLGLIIEVPAPVRLAILGVIKVVLPDEDTKTIRLNVNFLGTIDFEKKQIAFDASIYDSQIAEVTLSGDMALRISWGNNKNFLLSVGGFHPSFQAPPSLLYLSRITVNFLSKDKLSLIFTTYLAVTSNTAQFGAKIALDGKVTNKLTFKGHVSLDVLFQFKPFHLDVLFQAYLALFWKGKEKMSINISASLSGPTRWTLEGSAEVKILGIKFKVPVSAQWGREETDTLPGIPVLPRLIDALSDDRNWEAKLPAGKPPLVKLRNYTAANPVVHPLGQIQVSQKQVPLNVQVQKFGNQPANDAGVFTISSVSLNSLSTPGPVIYAKEDFAPAQFREMSDTAKLSSPSFTRFDSGVVVGVSSLKGTHVITREIKYEVALLGSNVDPLESLEHLEHPEVLEAAARTSAANRTPLAAARVKKSALAPLEMTVLEEAYGVVNSIDLKIKTGTVLYPTMAQALDKYAELVSADPLMKNDLMVIPEFEITP